MQVNKDLTRTMLAILFIGLLGGGSLLVMSPFLPALAWSAMIVISTWPLMLWAQARLRNRRSWATALMVGLILLLLVVPVLLMLDSLIAHADDIAGLPAKLTAMTIPPPPGWVAAIPLVGESLAGKWQFYAVNGLAPLAQQLTPYAGDLARWVVGQLGNLGLLLVNFLLVAVLSGVLYFNGESAARGVVLFARRLSGDRGEASVTLAAQAIRAVAMGIVLTALVQTLVGAIGLAIAGIPYPGLLTALMFVLALAQLGAGLVVLLSAGWMFWQGATGWGIALVIWSVIVGGLDNFLRPILIKRGADLPLLLIFAGVIGGLLSLGIIGLFIGPLLLAVTYTLIEDWVTEGMPAAAQPENRGDPT